MLDKINKLKQLLEDNSTENSLDTLIDYSKKTYSHSDTRRNDSQFLPTKLQ